MTKLRGLIVGAMGGLAGAALMGRAHMMMTKLAHTSLPPGEDATEKVANVVAAKFTNRRLGRSEKKTGGQIVHFAFGACTGALYGMLADTTPAITAGRGALLGAGLYLGAHGITVPALRLARSPISNTPAQESAEFVAHLVYGFVTDAVRQLLR